MSALLKFQDSLLLLPTTSRLSEINRSDADLHEHLILVEEHAETFVKEGEPVELLRTCIATRSFVDHLHDHAVLLSSTKTDIWAERFAIALKSLRENAERLLAKVDDEPARHRHAHYVKSIEIRINICRKMSEGLDVTRDLMEHEAKEASVNVRQWLANPPTPCQVSFGAPMDTGAIHPQKIFLLWKMTRFLQHKLLLLLVELSREAGPYGESTLDHLSIASKAAQCAKEIRRLAVLGDSPDTHGFIGTVGRWCREFHSRFTTQIVRRLRSFREKTFVEKHGWKWDDHAAREEVDAVTRDVCALYLEAAQAEERLKPLVPAMEIAAWRHSYGRATLIPDEIDDAVSKVAALTQILEKSAHTEGDAPALEQWIRYVINDAVFIHDGTVRPESTALDLFRILISADSERASGLFRWALEFEPKGDVEMPMVLLMWCGALIRNLARPSTADPAWDSLAAALIASKCAQHLIDEDRFSISAALFALSILVAPNTVDAGERLTQTLDAVLEHVDEPEQKYFLQHIADSIGEHSLQDGGRLPYPKLCVLERIFRRKDLVWPDSSLIPQVEADVDRLRARFGRP